MPLQKQVIPVNFTNGVDTKTTRELVANGVMLTANNIVKRQTGRYEKREGYRQVNNNEVPGGTVPDLESALPYGDEILGLTSSEGYVFDPANDGWRSVGLAGTCVVSEQEVFTRNEVPVRGYSAKVNDYIVSAVEFSRAVSGTPSNYDRVVIQIRRADVEDTVVFREFILGTAGDQVRAVIPYEADNQAVVVTERAGFLFTHRVLLNSLSALTNLVTGQSAQTDATPMHWVKISDTEAAVVWMDPSGRVSYGKIDSSGSFTLSTLLSPLVYNADVGGVTYIPTLDRVAIIGRDPGGSIATTLVVDADTGSAIDQNSVTHGSGIYYSSDIVYVEDISADEFRLVVTLEGQVGSLSSNYHNTEVRNYTYNSTTGLMLENGTTEEFDLGAASHLVTIDSAVYAVYCQEDQPQNTYFVIRVYEPVDGNQQTIVGHFEIGTAFGRHGRFANSLFESAAKVDISGTIPVTLLDSTTIVFPGMYISEFKGDGSGGVEAARTGFKNYFLDLTPQPPSFTQIGGQVFIGGATVRQFDGRSIFEAGFYAFPSNTYTLTPAGGGSMGAGTYQYSFVYEWYDAQGNRHQSSPSIPLSVTVAASGKVTISGLDLSAPTQKDNLKLVVYRTEAGGSQVFYRVPLESIVEDSNLPFFDDVSADSDITDNEILYTVGGVLENILPPPANFVKAHRNRIWLADTPDGTVRYSKELVVGEAPGFNEVLSIAVDDTGGKVLALASLDDKLIMFKRSQTLFLAGQGPDALGGNNDFTFPELIASDIGCTDPKSVVELPFGVIFKSEKGFYLLGRNLQFQDIGNPVENINDEPVTGVSIDREREEVKFTTPTKTLIYNYEFREWTTASYGAVSSVSQGNDQLHVKADGRLYQQTQGLYSDAGADITTTMETGWFKFSGLQGFQRIYELALLGQKHSDSTINVEIAYDFSDTYTETVTFDTSTGVPVGEDRLQFLVKPARQMCNSIKFRITDTAVNEGKSFSLIAASMEIGGIGKLNRLQLSQIGVPQ